MSKPKNEHMGKPSEPFASIAQMLVKLEDSGKLEPDMVKALHNHAQNALETIPGNIVTLAHNLAAAADAGWVEAEEASSAAYGIAELADLLNGFSILHNHLPEAKEVRK